MAQQQQEMAQQMVAYNEQVSLHNQQVSQLMAQHMTNCMLAVQRGEPMPVMPTMPVPPIPPQMMFIPTTAPATPPVSYLITLLFHCYRLSSPRDLDSLRDIEKTDT